MQPWVYFWLFDPLWGLKKSKIKGSFRISSNPEHPENNTVDYPIKTPIKTKSKRHRKHSAKWSKHFSHPQKSGWYFFTAILCAFAALLSLCLGWLGLIPFTIFALGVWANIANYRKFKKNGSCLA